jgi:hypothetical protein
MELLRSPIVVGRVDVGKPQKYEGTVMLSRSLISTHILLANSFAYAQENALSTQMPASNHGLLISLGLTILIGTATGIVSALLVGGAKQYLVKVVIPWYENLIYKDAKIEGRWHAEAIIDGQKV